VKMARAGLLDIDGGHASLVRRGAGVLTVAGAGGGVVAVVVVQRIAVLISGGSESQSRAAQSRAE
jgi:hypothetical protein